MKTLQSLRPHSGAKRPKKRVGRGPGSGHGKTACRGEKGQRSRSGGGVRPGFEGGQMPLFRRVPKRGFKNPFREELGILNVGDLARVAHGGTVDIALAKEKGRVRKRVAMLKILGHGDLEAALTVRAHVVSEGARKKIEEAGGRIELVGHKGA